MGILIAVVCIAGVLGWVIVKNDELAGLGRTVRPGSFRSPHGRLVHVKPLGQLPAEERWSRRFTRSFPLVSCIAVFACALISVGLLQSVPLSAIGATIQGVLNTPFPAAIITAEALLRSHEGKRLLPTYIIALFGALLMQGIVLGAFAALGWLASFAADGLGPAISWVGVLFSSPFAFALGAALVVAGGLGNAFDRFALGYVVDFIEPVFIDFPVFNVADIGVTCGFVLFLVGVIVSWRHEDRLSAELAASDGEGEGTDAR